MQFPEAPDSSMAASVRIDNDGRSYISVIDPRTGEVSDARIEPSLETDNYINLSFEPYLYRRPELLPERSKQGLFFRRPAYSFLKAELGLIDYQFQLTGSDILGQEDFKAKIQDLEIPDIIMAPWDSSDIVRVMLKVQWSDGKKSFTTREAWNSAVKDGQRIIDSFWDAVGQLKLTYRVGQDWESDVQPDVSQGQILYART